MTPAKALLVRIKKGTDGRTTLSCVRPDGTTTWQRQEGGHAAFFPRHDLTHVAVESILCFRKGFYGLVADGWDLSDFGNPWPRGRLPIEANLSERAVAFFDRERGSGVIGDAEELNQHLREYCTENGLDRATAYTEDDLVRVRQKRGELFSKWDAVRPGETFEVEFRLD
jgi:hypothetical protein